MARSESYFADRFGRAGYDGRGGFVDVEIDGSVHGGEARFAVDGSSARIVVGRLKDSNGTSRSAANDLDVLTHEYAHLVIQSQLHDTKKPSNRPQQRQYVAIQEGLADVFGAAIEQDWTIASVRNPASGEGMATHQRDVDPATADPHDWGGVLSNAAADIQSQLGWSTMEQAFYGAITNPRMTAVSSMDDVARFVVSAARAEGGDAAAQVALAAFRDNGLLVPSRDRGRNVPV